MVGLLVRLKLRLLVAGLRRGKAGAIVTFVLALVAAAVVGLGLGGALFALQAIVSVEDRTLGVVGAMTLVWLGWVLGPLVLAASDGTLEADRLAMFPLPRRTLVFGLLAGGAVGVGGVTTVLVCAGALAGTARTSAGPIGLGLGVTATCVAFAQCVAYGRAVSAAVAGAASRRRFRDVAFVIGPILGLALNIGLQVLSRALRDQAQIPPWVRTVAMIAGWSPPGLSARAIVDAGAGRPLVALGFLVASTASTAAALWVWGRSLDRILTQPPDGTVTTSRRGGRSESLFGGVLAWLPRNAFGACLARELRLTWRDPRQRAQLFAPLVGLGGLVVAVGSSDSGPRSVLLAAAPSFMLASVATNALGFDAKGHWVHVGADLNPRTLIAVKGVARAIIAIPPGLVAAVLLGVRAHALWVAPAGFALALAAIGLALSVGLPFSVVVPVPVAEARGNPFAQGGGGQGLAQLGPAFAMLFGGIAVLSAFAAPSLILIDHPVALVGVGLAQIALASAAAVGGALWAARRLDRRGPEILARLTRR